MRSRLNPGLRILGVLPTMYDGRTLHAREVLEELRKAHALDGVRVFKPVPRSVRFADASTGGMSIFERTGLADEQQWTGTKNFMELACLSVRFFLYGRLIPASSVVSWLWPARRSLRASLPSALPGAPYVHGVSRPRRAIR